MPRPDIDILIIGAGVLGLATAAELSRRGRAVAVVDPGDPNASSVAAGMIAPAFESAAENATPEQAAFLRRARDLWPDFAQAHGLDLRPANAEWRGPDAGEVVDRLVALGFRAWVAEGRALTDEDFRIEPEAALEALRRRLDVRQGRIDRVERTAEGWRAPGRGIDVAAAGLVVATGTAPSSAGLPEKARRLIDAVIPIRGQIGRAAGLSLDHVLRSRQAYLVPSAGGAMLGATMEPDRRDLEPDAAVGETLRASAEGLIGGPVGAVEWRVGVRGASPDGLPIAGPVGEAVHLALAPRRNGWLLAPLIARVVADGIEDRAPEADAPALAPARFSPG